MMRISSLAVSVLASTIITNTAAAQGGRAQSGAPPNTQSAVQAMAARNAVIQGCFDLYYQANGMELIGRVAFDLPATVSESGTGGVLRFIGGRAGFGAPNGQWTLTKSDSLNMRITFIDSGLLLNFRKPVADTTVGFAQGVGLTDTQTRRQARAIRQKECS